MAIAGIPTNIVLQQANAQTLISWDIVAGATSYSVQRSTDGVTFSALATPAVNFYNDTSVTVGTLYYYQVASVNGSGTSGYRASAPESIVPCNAGDMSLQELRLQSKRKADRENSEFVTKDEWNTYINQSYFELYDLLVTVYEDYFMTTPYTFSTTGAASYTLPSDFYKLLGLDLGIGGGTSGWATLRKFDFIERNRFVYPQIVSTPLGGMDLRYRVMGNNIYFIPSPSSGQTLRAWYIPKMVELLQDTDILTGISGWSEYVIVDAAIKALQKEESDVTVLGQQKMMLIKRINDSAMNRDVGMPDTISDVRSYGTNGFGSPGGDGPFGGY